MLIYACDSTAGTASVALCDDEKLLAEYTQNNGNTHSETLLPMSETMFRAFGITAADIDLFSCSAGPGSFTGVRIGAATVKGLAFGRKKPCIGVSTLEALAYNLIDFNGIVSPVMDARRNQLYTAFFRIENGELERLTDDRAIAFEQFQSELKDYVDKGYKVTLCGDGYRLVTSMLDYSLYIPCPERLRYQSAYSVAQMALAAFRRGEYTDDAGLKPVYLRLPQAERERNERLKKNPENQPS